AEPEPVPEPVAGSEAEPEPLPLPPVVGLSGCVPPQAASASAIDDASASRAFMPSSIAQLPADRLVTRGNGASSFAGATGPVPRGNRRGAAAAACAGIGGGTAGRSRTTGSSRSDGGGCASAG